MKRADSGTPLRIAAAALVGLTAALSSPDALGRELLERAREAGKVRVGYANMAPYGFADADGRLTGEAPEIARIILSRMGIGEIEGVVTDYESLVSDLKAGRFDMIAAGMVVLTRGCAEILFSEPTRGVREAFVVRAGAPGDVGTFEDVAADEDAMLAVVAGAAEGDYARGSGVPEERILVVPDTAAGVAAVESGAADALALTSPAAAAVMRARGEGGAGLEQTAPFVAGATVAGHGAFGFRKEDAAFAAEFNRHLTEFIGSEAHLALIEPFGLTEADLPQRTTAELCEPVS